IPQTPLAELLERYADRLMRTGYPETSQWPTEHHCFENGIFGHFLLRQLYLTLPEEIQKHFGGIAQQGRGQRFIAWATRMNPAGGALSPFLQFVYGLRSDLAAVLPDANGKDRGAFLEWAQTHGPREMGYNPDFARPTGPRPSSHCPDVTNQQVQNDVHEVTRTAIPADATVL